ncbi:MAG: YkgJ family cysteine cluster protein [Tagaea sp.]|nr:YkgJ family cysteine cluster protein [Tagaea sp.]
MTDTVLAAKSAAADALSAGRTTATAAEAALAANRVFDRVWARARGSIDAIGTIACKAGCGWCCHQHVAILPAEAVAVALAIAGTPLAEKFDREAPAILGTTNEARKKARRPCPFLIEGSCAVYEVRPNRCRAIHSRDLGFCQARYELGRSPPGQPAKPIPLEPVLMGDQVLRGMGQALAQAGLDVEPVELTHAVAALRRHPGLLDDYAKGRKLPETARAPDDPELE